MCIRICLTENAMNLKYIQVIVTWAQHINLKIERERTIKMNETEENKVYSEEWTKKKFDTIFA